MTALVDVDPDQIATYVRTVFRSASPGGTVSLRAFDEDDANAPAWMVQPIVLGDSLDPLISAAVSGARHAAMAHKKIVFCPPLATFNNPTHAREIDLVEAYTLSVEIDAHPRQSFERLEAVLGPPTMLVASGGEWTDPATQRAEPKLHAHWRTREPANASALPQLKLARKLAARLVNADPSNVTLVHPIRWAGTVHRKGEPRLVTIVARDDSRDIDLAAAVALLENAIAQNGSPGGTGSGNGADHTTGSADDTVTLMQRVMSGESFHPALTPLSARLIGNGMYAGSAVNLLYGLMDAVPTELQDHRWFARRAEIPGLVRSAEEKFSPTQGRTVWLEPQPLPEGLLPVAQFSTDFLPFVLAPWVDDISERMQCAPEFVAVTAIAALGAVLGRRVGVRPQHHTDWTEVSSFWGVVVGRPGWLKSPAMAEAMKPLMRLEAEAQKKNEEARRAYERELELWTLKKKAREGVARTALKKDGNARVDFGDGKPEEPQAKRYITSDSTYEALGAILISNPNGVLVFRDELVSLLNTLDREEYSAARGFYLTAWSGKSPYTFDRIIRGYQHIPAAFIGLVGSTQPGRISEYLRRATSTAEGNDGLIQRFSLMVWPDVSPHWRDTDEPPNGKAREAAWEVFERFSKLDVLAVKTEIDAFDHTLPFLRFDRNAQGLFNEWRGDFEKRIRSGELPEAIEGHLAKYRKLVPTLALVNHLADGGEGPIPHDSLKRALAFAEYLETHARRAYAAVDGTDADAARRILDHIHTGDLKDGFKARDIQHRDWSGLTDRARIGKGLELLADCDWVAPQAVGKNPAGGRPTTFYTINPRARS